MWEAPSASWRKRWAAGVSVQQILEMPSVFIGAVEQIVEEMYARRERYGLSYFVVADRHMEAFAPIVAHLRDK